MLRFRRATGQVALLGTIGLISALAFSMPIKAEKSEAQPKKKVDSLAKPLELIAEARKAYADVSDYTATMVTRERLEAGLSPEQVIDLKVRKSPFSVYMRWRQPKAMAGQEVSYIEGKNGGKMRVHSAGLLGAVGFVSLSPDSDLARRTSNHRITESGIGSLLDVLEKGWKAQGLLGESKTKISDDRYAGRPVKRVEVNSPPRAKGKLPFSRTIVSFDKQNHLPIYVENRGWPQHEGETGELMEKFGYRNLRLNVGLEDEVFQH